MTVKGHIIQEKQHLQSTKSVHPIDDLYQKTRGLSINNTSSDICTSNEVELDFSPTSLTPNIRSNSVAYLLVNPTDTTTGYVDLTGRFPRRSSKGNEYIPVGYHFDGNKILATPIKDRAATSIVNEWQHLHNQFKNAGAPPTTYILDNKKSKDLENMFLKEGIKFQLSPPSCHRTNKAERTIQTFKSYFKAG